MLVCNTHFLWINIVVAIRLASYQDLMAVRMLFCSRNGYIGQPFSRCLNEFRRLFHGIRTSFLFFSLPFSLTLSLSSDPRVSVSHCCKESSCLSDLKSQLFFLLFSRSSIRYLSFLFLSFFRSPFCYFSIGFLFIGSASAVRLIFMEILQLSSTSALAFFVLNTTTKGEYFLSIILVGRNFFLLQFYLIYFLEGQGIWGYVDGMVSQHDPTEGDKYMRWRYKPANRD